MIQEIPKKWGLLLAKFPHSFYHKIYIGIYFIIFQKTY